MLLYSGPVSPFARKVEVALHEKHLPFERVMVPFTQQTGYAPKHPVVVQHNPKGQVPVLIDDDIALFDSTLILEYLEDAYPTPPLYPSGAKPRAHCRMLEVFADEIMLPPLRVLMRRTESRRAPQAEEQAAEATLRTFYDRLEQDLGEHHFFCGDDLSVADITIFMSVFYAQRLRGPKLTDHPRLHAWYDRVAGRPAFARVTDEIAAVDRELSPRLDDI
jgi:glutathione S-transferase